MNNLRILAILLWIPFLLESSFIPFLTFSIPGIPFTLGRICLVILGVLGLNFKNRRLGPSPFRFVVIFLLIGSLVGTFFSQNIGRDLISYIGVALLFMSAFGAALLISLPETQKLLKYFFYSTYFYWVYYLLSITITEGEFITYGEIYRAGFETDSSLMNYHSFGLLLSCGIVYIAQLNGWIKKINFVGVAFMLTGILAIFITESRANFLITLFALLVMFFLNSKVGISLVFRLVVLFTLIGYSGTFAMKSNERLNRRFDLQNTEYIEQSTNSRIILIGLTFKELIELPFGGGVNNNRVNYFGTEYQPHNQYLTFILFSGIFGIAALIVWFIVFMRILLKFTKSNLDYYKPHLSALIITMLVMFTNDLSGAFFFLMIALQIWLAKEVLSGRKSNLQ